MNPRYTLKVVETFPELIQACATGCAVEVRNNGGHWAPFEDSFTYVAKALIADMVAKRRLRLPNLETQGHLIPKTVGEVIPRFCASQIQSDSGEWITLMDDVFHSARKACEDRIARRDLRYTPKQEEGK